MRHRDVDLRDEVRPRQVVRVLVADDHAIIRLGIRDALGAGFEVCAEAADAEGAVAAALREQPDICLLDVGMPGSGITAAAAITAQVPGTAVVMISSSCDEETMFSALRAGAVGYLRKDMAFTRLPEALFGVLDGEAAVPRVATSRLLSHFRLSRVSSAGHAVQGSARLTSRETDVLELLLEGFSTAEIAGKLFLSAPTVRSHLAAVMRKLGVRNRDALRALFEVR